MRRFAVIVASFLLLPGAAAGGPEAAPDPARASNSGPIPALLTPGDGPFGRPRSLLLDLTSDRSSTGPAVGEARPRALVSGDFDGDGTADLAMGFSAGGRGIVALVPGDADAIHPFEPEALKRRGTDHLDPRQVPPFRAAARTFDLPAPADFLGVGDFDDDGRLDLVAAAEGGRAIFLLKGDGRGDFERPLDRALPGRLKRMLGGEIDLPDSLADILVVVEREGRQDVLSFEGAEGAWKAEPEVLRRGGPITTLALGDLDGDGKNDLVLGVTGGMEVVHGRDRALALGSAARAAVPAAVVERQALGFTPVQAALGRFGQRAPRSLALVGDDGALRTGRAGAVGSARSLAAFRRGSLVIAAPVAEGGDDALVALDDTIAAEPVAALSLRLGPEAAESLVVLDGSAPAGLIILPPAAPLVYTVTTIADGGPGSLRQAILDANAHAGLDTIAFAITPSGNLTLAPLTPLPDITDPVTLDATTQPGNAGTPIVELDGSGPLPPGTNGLVVRAGSSVVRGLVIHGFSGSGVALDGAGHNLVEGNFIGLDHTGTTALGNQDAGVVIRDSHLNTIGGTALAARNVISGNLQAGVAIRGPSTFEAEYASRGAAVAICDLCIVSMPITISDEKLIDDVNVRVSLVHTFDSDLVLTLVAPDNTRIVLSNRHGGGGDNYNSTLFDDGAATPIAAGVAPFSGSFAPDEALSILNGRSLTGTWNLEVADTAGGDVGSLLSWSMTTEGETIFGNVIAGNLIGTDVTGTVGIGNTKGVVIDQSPQNLVGGTVPGARNVIAGGTEQASGHGIEIQGFPALNALRNTVQGNSIGTDITGTGKLPNHGSGIEIFYADACQIGGTAAGARNLISANLQYGIHTQVSSFNRIQGNFLGTDITGTVALSQQDSDHGSPGVTLDYGTSNTLVGGSVAAARNIASGGTYGITTRGSNSFPGNSILGNYVGTNPAGTQAVPNLAHGILIDSPGVQVGGPGPGEGNLASGNNAQEGACGIAVWPDGTSSVVQGNVLGLDATGTVKLGNNRGLLVNGGPYVRYGGANPGEGNVIAGNDQHGVWIYDAIGNSLPQQGSSLDTPKGIPDLATTTSVVNIPSSSTDLLVTVKVHVGLNHTFDSDLVLTLIAPDGRRIALANRRGGAGDDYSTTLFDDFAATPIALGAPPYNGTFQPEEPLSALSGIGIGGAWTLEVADVASGDTGILWGWGLDFESLATTRSSYQAQLLGNLIGTNAAGATGLGNGGDGIFGEFSNLLTIGAPGGGNVIAGNAGRGIFLNANFCAANVVQSNAIGVKPDGVTPLGNGGDGISVVGPVGLIGGPGAAFGNHLAWNGGAGVNVTASTLLRQTTIRVNSIHDNGGLGIDLAPAGVTPNDAGDGDLGANVLQNFPIVTSVTPSFMNSVLISGTLNSRPASKYTIDVYGSPAPDPSGYGEGRVWLGSGTFTTDVSGNLSWTVLTQTTSLGLVTATATDSTGNTSEFSGEWSSPQEASAAKTMTVAPGAGGTLTFSYTPACGATDHVLYWGTVGPGMLGAAGMSWTSAACGLGTSGTASVLIGNPPAGQAFYFAVVGQNGSVEGSYGQNSSNNEEPEATFPAICARPQLLGGGCF